MVIVITVVAAGIEVQATALNDENVVVDGAVTMAFHEDMVSGCNGGGGGGGGGGDSTGFSITISILWRRGSRVWSTG